MLVHLTQAAASELRKRGRHILFSCRSGGCNGFEYILEAVDPPCPTTVDTQEFRELSVHVCNVSMLHILGTKICWKEDIMGSRFVFENPNAQSMCGCGATFST